MSGPAAGGAEVTGTARLRMTRKGTVAVDQPAAAALALFTPEGERSWIPGWAPRYPAGTPDLVEGVTFETDTPGGTATWLVTRYDPDTLRASYAYVLPGHRATLVDVHVVAGGAARSEVRVTYHMTALSPEGDAFVRAFAEGFEVKMEEWARALGRAEARSPA